MIDEKADLKTQFRQAETENRQDASWILDQSLKRPLTSEEQGFLKDLLGLKNEKSAQPQRTIEKSVDQLTQDVTAFIANHRNWGEDVKYPGDDRNHPGIADLARGTAIPEQVTVIGSVEEPEVIFNVKGLPITIKGDSARRIVGAKAAMAA